MVGVGKTGDRGAMSHQSIYNISVVVVGVVAFNVVVTVVATVIVAVVNITVTSTVAVACDKIVVVVDIRSRRDLSLGLLLLMCCHGYIMLLSNKRVGGFIKVTNQ